MNSDIISKLKTGPEQQLAISPKIVGQGVETRTNDVWAHRVASS